MIVVGNAGALNELIKTNVFEIFTEYRLLSHARRAFAETQFTLRADRARIPDVAWVSESRLADYRDAGVEVWQVYPVTSESEQLPARLPGRRF